MNEQRLVQAIADERGAMADLLLSLSPEQLATPSLCAGWTVHDVAAHLTMPFSVSRLALLGRVLTEQMSVDRAVSSITRELAAQPIEAIVADLRDNLDDRRHPPGMPVAPLVDLLAHGEDIRRPLGIRRPLDFDRVAASMAFLRDGRAFGFVPASRVRGLRFVATDGDGTWGQGAVVHGPATSLMLAVLGRTVAFPDLGGAAKVLVDRIAGVRKDAR